MPEENSNTMPMFSDIDVTLLSEEELSTLRDVFERQWVLHETNAGRIRKLEEEIKEMEEKITQRSRGLFRKAIADFCNICFKVKVASTSLLICQRCRKKTCPRCGKRDQSVWRCVLCLKKQARFTFTGEWSRDRSQVQDMLNKIAEESVRRIEMPTGNRQEEPVVSVSFPPCNTPLLHHVPASIKQQQQRQRHFNYNQSQRKLKIKRYKGEHDDDDDDDADDDDDDDVFEDEGSDKYLSFPYQEEHSQGEMFESSSSIVPSSSAEDEPLNDEFQGASGSDRTTSRDSHELENQASKRKVAAVMADNEGLCPLIQKISLHKDRRIYGGLGTGSEFGVRVVGGRMCTGGFNGVYVAKVTRGSLAEKWIKEGDQILEWNHVSMMDLSFEQVRRIVADSPEDVTLVVCHNSVCFEQRPRQHSRERIELAMRQQRKTYESIKCWSRWSLAQLIADDNTSDEGEIRTQAERTRGQIQLQLWHDPNGNNLIVRVLSARGLSLQDMPNQELPNPHVLLYLLPNREISSQFKTNIDPQTVTPKWDLSFIFANIPEDELFYRTLEVTLWSEDQTKGHTFLGEALIKLTPEFLQSGAQCTWFDLVDHDDSSFSFPVPMPRRHTLLTSEPRVEKEGRTFSWETDYNVKRYSFAGVPMSHRSLSTIDLSRRDSQVFIDYSSGDIKLHHTKQRRADVRAETFQPKSVLEFREKGIDNVEDRTKMNLGYKWSSAPCTPARSAQVSTEDLRRKRSSSPALVILKTSALTLSEYLAQNKLPDAKPVEQELEVKEEKEEKRKGAFGAKKKYPESLRLLLSKLTESPSFFGEAGRPSTPRPPSVSPGYRSAPTTPSRSSSIENLQRERSYTSYTLPSSGHTLSPYDFPKSPGPGLFKGRVSRTISPSYRSSETASPILEMKENELHFSYSKTELSNVAEQELSVTEGKQLGATGLHEASISPKEEEHFRGKSSPASLSGTETETETAQSRPLRQIPRISIQLSTSPTDVPQSNLGHQESDGELPVQTEVEKKGAMHVLRRYSKHLRPRSSLKAQEKLSLYGEDPEKGDVGLGQIRRGSHQGHEIGYIRIGLSASHDTLEVEIIRAVGILVPGDSLPDTYVKTYLVKDQNKLLKRKTSTTRHSANPEYNCKIRYPGRDLNNKELLVGMWCKQGIFGRKVLLGEVRIALGSLNLSVKQVSWYKLMIEYQMSDGD